MSRNTVPVGVWIETADIAVRNDMPAVLARRAVVLLGEQHDRADHHRWQLDTIDALHGCRPDMVLGFEMFPRRVQPVLDRWTAGHLGEEAFLAEVDWPRVWGMDAALYLPLFHFARVHRLPMLALNIDRETGRRVATQGFAQTPVSEREGVGDPAPARASYRDRLFQVFKMHPAAGQMPNAGSDRFERFIRAQLFWDRAMAEVIAAACAAPGRPLVVGIMGRGHIEYGDGVPHQLAALGVDDVATAVPWDADADLPPRAPRIADFLVGVASQT